jgi:hypothetical protein
MMFPVYRGRYRNDNDMLSIFVSRLYRPISQKASFVCITAGSARSDNFRRAPTPHFSYFSSAVGLLTSDPCVVSSSTQTVLASYMAAAAPRIKLLVAQFFRGVLHLFE